MSILRKIWDKLRRRGVQVAPQKLNSMRQHQGTAKAPVKLTKELRKLMLQSPFPHCIIEQEFATQENLPGFNRSQSHGSSRNNANSQVEPLKWSILDVSDTFCNMMGISPDTLIGTEFFDYVDPKVSDRLVDQLSGSGPDFRMKTVLMSRATYVDEEGVSAAVASSQSHVPLKVDMLGVVVPESRYLVLVVLSVALLENLVRLESTKAEDDSHPAFQRGKSMTKSFVLQHVGLTSRNLARMPSFLRPQRYPQGTAEQKKIGQEAVSSLGAEDMKEAVLRSRKRRDKRLVKLNDESFDERCKRWLGDMVDFFQLPPDSEASFTLKLWTSFSKSAIDAGTAHVPLQSMHWDDSDDDGGGGDSDEDFSPGRISPTTLANTAIAAGPIDADPEPLIKRSKSTKSVMFVVDDSDDE